MFTPWTHLRPLRSPALDARPSDDVIEVVTAWQDTLLSVTHVPVGTPLFVVDVDEPRPRRHDGRAAAYFLPLPVEATGCSRWQFLGAQPPELQVMKGVRVWLRSVDGTEQLLEPSDRSLSNPSLWALTLNRDEQVRVELPQVDLLVRRSRREHLPVVSRTARETAAVASFLGCAAVAGVLMGSAAYFSPPLNLRDEGDLAHQRLLAITHYLDAASEKDRARQAREQQTPAPSSGSGQAAQRAAGREGSLGTPTSKSTRGRVAVRGPTDNTRRQLRDRAALLREVTTGGMIGLLRSSAMGEGPASPFGAAVALGQAERSAQGRMFGETIGESVGSGALGLSGIGSGGGAVWGNGIGRQMQGPATIGGGSGKTGFGVGRGLDGGEHQARGPRIRPAGVTETSGRLPAQTVQRVVRQNFGRFRLCYEQGLGRNPNLAGRVSVRFVIGGDGSVSAARSSGDLADAGVASCVTSAFYGLSFPAPEGGTVRVTYPLLFSPS